jgi:hypothetical protein
MGMLDWLRRKQAGDNTAELVLTPEESEFAGLNIKQVLDAHMAWRTRLQNILSGTSDETVEVHQVAPDNLCVLGKWLYSPGGQNFKSLPEFEALRNSHSKFHMVAGEILAAFNSGKTDAANKLLKGDFRSLSDSIQLDLVRLYAAKK